jgi:NTP pyrophosphatase (non-canonical NTP hydrolase)
MRRRWNEMEHRDAPESIAAAEAGEAVEAARRLPPNLGFFG